MINHDFKKYADINPYKKNDEESSSNKISNEDLRYLKKISSVPYILLDDIKKRKNVKFLGEPLFNRNNSLTKNIPGYENMEENSKKIGIKDIT